MGRFEVTQDQWREVAQQTPVERSLLPDPSFYKEGGKFPVEDVNWYECIEFCERLSRMTGRRYRLPTEAEWEYACRAGTTTRYHFGDIVTPILANYGLCDQIEKGFEFDADLPYLREPDGEVKVCTIPVGSLGVFNAFGLSDMHGNVMEWCADWYQEDFYKTSREDHDLICSDPSSGWRVCRGGEFLDHDGPSCRPADRSFCFPALGYDYIGFRVVVSGSP